MVPFFNLSKGMIHLPLDVQIGIVCGVVGVLIGFLTFKRERDKDVQNEASDQAVIKTKLDNINAGVESIRIDIKANERRVSELSERVIRVEESSKQAHKRLDHLEKSNEN